MGFRVTTSLVEPAQEWDLGSPGRDWNSMDAWVHAPLLQFLIGKRQVLEALSAVHPGYQHQESICLSPWHPHCSTIGTRDFRHGFSRWLF